MTDNAAAEAKAKAELEAARKINITARVQQETTTDPAYAELLDMLMDDAAMPGGERLTPADYAIEADRKRVPPLATDGNVPAETEKAPMSQRVMDEAMEALRGFSDDMKGFIPEKNSESAVERSGELIGTGTQREKKSLRESTGEAWSFFKRKMVDAGDSVTRIAKATGNKVLYAYYNMARASASAGASMIKDAQTSVTGEKVGESLNGIFDPIMAKGTEYYKAFQTYMFDLHNIRRMNLDKEKAEKVQAASEALANFDRENPGIAQPTDEMQRKLAMDVDEELAELSRERIRLLRNLNSAQQIKNKPVFDYEVTAEMSRGRAEELLRQHPEFAEYRAKIRRYVDNLMQYRVDSGLMTQENADFLKEYYPDYVPTFRVQEGDKISRRDRRAVRVGKTVGRAEGGTEKLVPLHEALGKQTMQVVREGSKNRFGRMLLDLFNAKTGDENVRRYIRDAKKFDSEFRVDIFDEEQDDTLQKNNVFSVFAGGKLYELTVDDSLFDAVKALSPDKQSTNIGIRAIRSANKVFKAMVTGWNPTFTVRNVVRDAQTAGLYSRDIKAWARNYPKALREIRTNGEMWQRYKALGGDFSSVYDYLTGTVQAPKGKVAKLAAKMEAVNMAMEQAPRLAEFMSVVEKGDGSMDNLMDAMLAAADVTVNFGRSGSIGKMLNANFVPFLNPGIQGFDKMVRYATESRTGKQWAKLVVKAGLLGVIPSLLNALLYRDDDEWDDLRDSDKDTCYLFKLGDGYWLKIPKGRELSLLGMVADRAVDALRGEKVDIISTLNTAANQVAPANPLKQNILSAAVDTRLFDAKDPGRAWYGGDIESQRLQQYAPGKRYDSKTDAVSKAVGGFLGVSPKKLNYLADQYTGVAGDVLLPLLTPQAERGMFSKAFSVDAVTSNKLSGLFYDRIDELTWAKNDGDTEAAVLYRYYNKQKSAVSELYKQIRLVEESGASDSAKKASVRGLTAQINDIMRQTMESESSYAAAVPSVGAGASDKRIAEAYMEANREAMGAEYALQTYNQDVYEAAKKAVTRGISYEKYYDYYMATRGITKKEDRLQAIDKLPMTIAEKNALYRLNGYAASKIYDAPWNVLTPGKYS